jgi:predicted lipoprotein with Yx(FWY)xxD motif
MLRFPITTHRTRSVPAPLLALLLALALAALLGPAGASAGQSSRMGSTSTAKTKNVAKKAANSTLGETILTNLKGRTLYSLSVEKKGKFTCVGACLSTWHPLLVPAGTKPLGPVTLSTVTRPEDKIQVTYKGLPLYTFAGDTAAGQANGEGIKDVGTWHAAEVSKISQEPAPHPEPENPYPY